MSRQLRRTQSAPAVLPPQIDGSITEIGDESFSLLRCCNEMWRILSTFIYPQIFRTPIRLGHSDEIFANPPHRRTRSAPTVMLVEHQTVATSPPQPMVTTIEIVEEPDSPPQPMVTTTEIVEETESPPQPVATASEIVEESESPPPPQPMATASEIVEEPESPPLPQPMATASEIVEEPESPPPPQPMATASEIVEEPDSPPQPVAIEIIEVPDTRTDVSTPFPIYYRVGENKQIINPIHMLTLLAALGGGTLGYAFSIAGAFLGIPIFLARFSSFYVEANVTKNTNFCTYADFGFILTSCLIPLSAFMSMWIAFKLSNIWGRKPVLVIGVIGMLFGAFSLMWTLPAYGIIASLALVGTGAGFINQVIPTIISELAPEKVKNKLGILFGYQAWGNLLVFVVCLAGSYYPRWAWRLPFGVLTFLALLLLLISLCVSETPIFFIPNDELRAKKVLKKHCDPKVTDVEVEFDELASTIKNYRGKNPIRDLLTHQNRPTLIIKAVAQILPQMLGASPLLFFGPLVSESLSSYSRISLVTSVGGGFLGLISMLLATWLLGRLKRRRLALISSFAILGSQVVLWVIFFLDASPTEDLKIMDASITAVALAVTYAGFIVLTNPHGWINSSITGAGRALGDVFFNSLALLMSVVMNEVSVYLLCALQAWIFVCTSAVAVLTACFIFFFVPETTDVLEHSLVRRVWSLHWYWKKYTQAKGEENALDRI